jgi:hypothetical protein
MAKKVATRFSKSLSTSTQPKKTFTRRKRERKKKRQNNPIKSPIKIARRFTKSPVANPRNQNERKVNKKPQKSQKEFRYSKKP